MAEKKNYWDDPKYFDSRRLKIYEDKKSGKYSNAELVKKYGVSQGRLLQIYNKVKAELEAKAKLTKEV